MDEMCKIWKEFLAEEFKKPYAVQLQERVRTDRRSETVYPPSKDTFNAFKFTPFEDIRAVLLAQDPYHTPNKAHGLAFSVPDGESMPPSLQNIFKELNEDIGCPIPKSGNLTKWTKQGVFLLNTALTVVRGQPGSHSGIGWRYLIEAAIEKISIEHEAVAFLLWGDHARSIEPIIKNKERHLIIATSHPSPLSAYRGWWGNKSFSRTNAFLKSKHIDPINWALEN